MIRALCRLMVKTFFREISIEGREHLPESGAVIFTPNHPNALVDPLLLFFLSPPFHIRFVAKAPLFRIPLLGAILRSLGSIPVIRKTDAAGEVDYTAFFSSCVDALAHGQSIAIFPEGRSWTEAYMAPLRTGPARLFFIARSRGIPVTIVPVGLNYERATIFRSSVLVAIAPPINPAEFETGYETDPARSVRGLTEQIAESLRKHVLQNETYHDRELMLLLERLSSERQEESWKQRFSRLKQFESGLGKLHVSCSLEIDRLRKMLRRYASLSARFDVTDSLSTNPTALHYFFYLLAWPVALIGWILNWIPYHMINWLIRLTRKDSSEAATYKMVYSIFLFPIVYFAEGYWLSRIAEWWAVLLFASAIVPLSYFTLFFFEWRERIYWFSGRNPRVEVQLDRLRRRILLELERLAARPELKAESNTAPG